MLLLENAVDDKAEDRSTRLVLVTTSANLTRSGWHENLEVAHVLEIASGEANAARDDMLHKRGLLSVLESASPGAESQPAIKAVREFLLGETQSPSYLKHGGRLRPRLYVGREPLPEFLREAGRIVEPRAYCLEIISPFFENTAEAKTLKALIDMVSPLETRVYLPFGDDGKAQCAGEYFEAVRGFENVHWARLPDELTRWSSKSDKVKQRNVHAKLYRLFKGGRSRADWREIQLVGSVNLTGAAHAGSAEQNFETAILVDVECKHEPDWWMKRLSALPAEFDPRVSEDDTGKLGWHRLTLRFDWQADSLEYYWEAEPQRPELARIVANGCPLFEFGNIEVDRWRLLHASAKQAVRTHLIGSSLVDLLVADELPQPLLIQETDMAQALAIRKTHAG